jgi:hypothetical protein
LCSAYSLFLTEDEAVLTLSGGKANTDKAKVAVKAHTSPSGVDVPKADGVLRMRLRNANAAAKVTGLDELPGTSNYFIGNDPAKWRTNVPVYSKVKYEGIYSGIDLVYYGNQQQLEYDFIVAPGADPRRIAFDIHGAKRIRQDERGELIFKVGEEEIRWHKPVVYQERSGNRLEIAARYAITNKNQVRFEVAKYDAGRPLYIDPLIYSTYLGGKNNDVGLGITVDSAGNAYITGYTESTDFPTMNPSQSANGGGWDAFVTKINAAGSALVYSTYLGGTNADKGCGIVVDSAGNAYVTGFTWSTNFPTKNPLQPTFGGGNYDAFVAKINSSGSALVYSTYLGGSGYDSGQGIAVDSAGNVYVTGGSTSTDFPTTPAAFQTVCNGGSGCNNYGDTFVSKINPSGSALVYSTFLGGNDSDWGFGIALDISGNAYITGYTLSIDFPVTPGAFQTSFGGGGRLYDAFITEINPEGSALVYSTYLGGSNADGGFGIAVNSSGNAYVTGFTRSTDFPTTLGAFQTQFGGGGGDGDAFVAKLNPAGSALVYSSYLGGSGAEDGYGITVDSAGNAYVTGVTGSTDFPTVSPLKKTLKSGDMDAFVTEVKPTGTGLFYSTYLGGRGDDSGQGIAVDSAGNVYVTGDTIAQNFPTKNPLQITSGGNSDAFVTKLDVKPNTTTTLTSFPNPSTYGQAVTFTATVLSGAGAPPDGEAVTFKKGTQALGTGLLSGGTATFSISTLKVGTSSITAVYGGDSNFAGSKSNTVSQVVSKATTTTTLASSLNPSNFGQSVTFTASVAPQFSGTVKGSVTFYDGTTALKTVALSGGVAKFTTSTLTSGAHSITATYNGSTSFDGSSASLTQTVNQGSLPVQ